MPRFTVSNRARREGRRCASDAGAKSRGDPAGLWRAWDWISRARRREAATGSSTKWTTKGWIKVPGRLFF